MAEEFKLSHTAAQIDAKLNKIDSLAEKSELPTKTSDLANDSGFATENYVQKYAQPIGDYALKGEIPSVDLSDYALKSEIPTDYLTEIPEGYVTEEELQNKGFLTEYIETDPSVPAWAKAEKKPTYSAKEVGALPADTVIPVKTSDLVNDSGFITGYSETDPTVPSWAKQPNKPVYTAEEVGALPSSTVVPTKVSELENDRKFLTEYVETDPSVPAWAKSPNKPIYTAEEVGALPSNTVIPTVPTNVSAFTNDAGYLTEHQSLDGLATEAYVNESISGKADKTEILSAVEGLASTSYVDTAIANLVNSAPDALNTLDELAAALGDDENFATTVTNQIAEKVSKTELTTEVNSALPAAKESGEFDGADGYTPVKGTDYWTEADKAEMVETARSSIPTFNLTEMGLPLVPIDGTSVIANMDCTAIRSALETGPIKSVFNISLNGHSTPFTSVACGLYLSSDDCWQVSSVATMIYGGNPVTMVGTFNVRTDKITVNMYTIAYRSDIQSYIDSSILGGEW